MKKSVVKVAPKNLPVFPVGSQVLILRPNLWNGCVGEVIKQEAGIHRVKIQGKHDVFHSDVPGDQLETFI